MKAIVAVALLVFAFAPATARAYRPIAPIR